MLTVFLPPEKSDARLNPTITVLLGFIFVQTIIASNGPKSEHLPIISIFTELTLILSLINLTFCAICEGLGAIPDDRPMPRFVRWTGFPLVNVVCHKLKINFLRLLPIINILWSGLIKVLRRMYYRKGPVGVSSQATSFNSPENEDLGTITNIETYELEKKIPTSENQSTDKYEYFVKCVI